ncbi:maleylpyruvate isomerase family mycothiol-dependent enzyme [Jannaschia sp. R86511]|uniref:maleylpyruvate isomerase family mycothiol-dependent enzyme n=1 Tax=Jannaschia sp. R86511 TaxID=3093853 RepID=UPI0036D322A3
MDSRRPALDHLSVLPVLTGRFAAALAAADLDAVPAATGRWRVRDVGLHLLGVHRWAAEVVRRGTRPPRAGAAGSTAGPVGPGDDELVPAYRAAADELLAVLAEVDPERECWTLDRTDRRAGFWVRRQVHETAVHLWDVRSPVDATPEALADLDPDLCADGVDELLQLLPSRLGAARAPLPGLLALRATDLDRRWLLGPDWLPSAADAVPVATVEAPARGLLLHVWGRGRFATTAGDPATLRAFDRAPARG